MCNHEEGWRGELREDLDKLHLAMWAMSLLAFILGCLLGSFADRLTVDSVNAWLDKKPLAEQYDFLDARLKFLPGVRRQIAEHWCLQNPNTVRVCHNATRYSRPVGP